jgi:hypothetical protein
LMVGKKKKIFVKFFSESRAQFELDIEEEHSEENSTSENQEEYLLNFSFRDIPLPQLLEEEKK